MEFFLRLSLEVLLAGILFILFSKIKYAKLVRTIFWTVGLGSLLVPVGTVIYTGKSLKGFLDILIFGQKVFLTINPISAFLLLVISVSALLYTFYDLFVKEENTKCLMKNCMYSTIILYGVCLSLMLENWIFYAIDFALTGYFFYKLITSQKEYLANKNSCPAFLTLQYFSVLFLTIAILLTAVPAGGADFQAYINSTAENKTAETSAWIILLLSFLCQMIFSYKLKFENESVSGKIPVLYTFLPVMIKFLSLGVLFKFLYLSVIPARVWAEGLALLFSLTLLVLGIIYLINKKSSILNLGSGLLELTFISISLAGIVYNIPIIAITPLVVVFVLYINNALADFAASVTAGKENTLSDTINETCCVMAKAFVPPFCGFYAVLLFILSLYFILAAKSTNIILTISLLLTAAYILMLFFKSLPKFRYLPENIKKSFKNKEFTGLNAGFGVLVSALAVILGIFITIPIRLAILTVSYIISEDIYKDFYYTLITCTNYAQNIFCILIAAIAVFLIVRYLILPKIKISCLKK